VTMRTFGLKNDMRLALSYILITKEKTAGLTIRIGE